MLGERRLCVQVRRYTPFSSEWGKNRGLMKFYGTGVRFTITIADDKAELGLGLGMQPLRSAGRGPRYSSPFYLA